MKLWTNVKVRTKQQFLIGVCCLSLLAIGCMGMWQMKRLSRDLSAADENMHHVALLGEMKNNFLAMRFDLAVMLVAKDPAKLKAMHGDLAKRAAAIREEIAKLEASKPDGFENEQLALFKSGFEQYQSEGNRMAEMTIAAHERNDLPGVEAAAAFGFKEVAPLYAKPGEAVTALVAYNIKQSESSYAADLTSYRRDLVAMNVAIFGAIAFALAFGYAIYRSISIPLERLFATMASVAAGDLTVRSNIDSQDEMGQLAAQVDTMAESLHHLTTKVTLSSIKVSIAADRLHSMSDQVKRSSEELEGRSATISTASEEMAGTSAEIAMNCNDAAHNGTLANQAAATGASVVDETVSGMVRIAERVKRSSDTVEELGRRSDQIGEIIGTIEDIADQTNLLALNAAIEAARAGEQGRGFAVVADAVRALAERTTTATREIGAMIKAIQSETRQAVLSMEQGGSEVEIGSAGAARSGEALQQILRQMDAVTQQVNLIATSAEEQTATTSEISRNILQITGIAQQTSSESRNITGEVNQLMTLASELTDTIGRFRIEEEKELVINKAKSAHLVFTGKIRAHLEGHQKVDPQSLPDHHNCMFGKWYDSKGSEICGDKAGFREIVGPHAKVHELGKAAVLAYNAGDRVRGAALCEEMVENSTKLLGLLEQLERQCSRQEDIAVGKAV
jgi:methyl-accepting chemotaxis protein